MKSRNTGRRFIASQKSFQRFGTHGPKKYLLQSKVGLKSAFETACFPNICWKNRFVLILKDDSGSNLRLGVNMKKTNVLAIALVMIMVAAATWAANRVVLYEDFAEDECLWCHQVAAAVASFRESHSYEEVAVVSYLVRGGSAVPGGADRLDYYGEEIVPVVVGDGQDNLGPQPIDQTILENHYGTRHNVPPPLIMSVVNTGGNNYTVSISAEEAMSGIFMAVAYENITYEGDPYPCFARQILTDPYGDDFNIAQGQTIEIPLSVGCGNHSGVVAWVQAGSKGAQLFRPHECIQAADSNSQSVVPTPTPIDPTPTPTSAGPTPTPSGDEFSQSLELSSDFFHPNDSFILDVKTVNPTSTTYNVMQYVVLEVAGFFYFWPNWSANPDYGQRSYPPGHDESENIFDFIWPSGVGAYNGIHFWLASLDQSTLDLACPYDMVEWGYGG
jgi:hypothetical protein